MTNKETAIHCSNGYVLRDNKCTKIEGVCLRQGTSTCEYCENSQVITQRQICNNNENNCIYEEDDNCLICEKNI